MKLESSNSLSWIPRRTREQAVWEEYSAGEAPQTNLRDKIGRSVLDLDSDAYLRKVLSPIAEHPITRIEE